MLHLNPFAIARAQAFVQQNLGSGMLMPAVLLLLWSTGQFQWLFSIFNFVFILFFVVPTVVSHAHMGKHLRHRPSCCAPRGGQAD